MEIGWEKKEEEEKKRWSGMAQEDRNKRYDRRSMMPGSVRGIAQGNVTNQERD